MERESGDDYARRIASYIRENEQNLANVPGRHRSQQGTGWLGWIGVGDAPAKPLVFGTDLHHLFYLLMRFEDLGVNVGPLDVRLPPESISRPLSYVSLLAKRDKSEAGSIASFRSSLSVVSKLSLGGGWWPSAAPPTIESEVKYLYSAITKLPALSVHQSSLSVVAELADDPPVDYVIPPYAFKNLQSLECLDIDPRMILGWDQLAEGLRSLVVKRSGIEDVTELFLEAVVEDEARRKGDAVKPRQRKLIYKPASSRRPSWRGTPLPSAVLEQDEPDASEPSPVLARLKWAFLRHLSLSDNALTFFPMAPIPRLVSLSHLDLSSNLLVSVPAGLNQPYNLVSLNLSDNMIESVLGIYTMLGQVLTLNLSRNRIESLCGLERLVALERLDIRHNHLDESGEVGRLITLPNLSALWVDGNPFTEVEDGYRAACFNQFLKEGKSITLDGQGPSYMERRSLISPPAHTPEPRPTTTVPSPTVVAVGSSSHLQVPTLPDSTSSTLDTNGSQNLQPQRKRKARRVVDFGSVPAPDDAAAAVSPAATDGAADGAETVATPLPAAKSDPGLPNPGADLPRRAMGRHSRMMTTSEGLSPSPLRNSVSATISAGPGRRSRISTAFFDVEPGSPESGSSPRSADAFRAEIEALRATAPDNWLKVLSQKQYTQDDSSTPSPQGSPPLSSTRRKGRHSRGMTEF